MSKNGATTAALIHWRVARRDGTVSEPDDLYCRKAKQRIYYCKQANEADGRWWWRERCSAAVQLLICGSQGAPGRGLGIGLGLGYSDAAA